MCSVYIMLCSCALVCGERNGLLGSCTECVVHAHTIHQSVILRYTEVWQTCTITVWWGEMLNFNLHFICNKMMLGFVFFFRNSVIHSMFKYTWYFCQGMHICLYYFYWYWGRQMKICICLTGQGSKEKWSGNHPILTAQTAICNSVLNYHCR